jgi:hypothetical protein
MLPEDRKFRLNEFDIGLGNGGNQDFFVRRGFGIENFDRSAELLDQGQLLGGVFLASITAKAASQFRSASSSPLPFLMASMLGADGFFCPVLASNAILAAFHSLSQPAITNLTSIDSAGAVRGTSLSLSRVFKSWAFKLCTVLFT